MRDNYRREGKILHVNDKYIRLTGEDQNSIIGMPFHRNFHPDRNKELEKAIRRTLAEGSPWTGQLKGIDRGGSSFWLQTQIKPVREENGVIGGYIAVGMDITELHLTKSNLKNSLFVDQLTGFGTRAKLLADNNDLESPLIAFYNIDRFSSINRFYGMKTGDEVLIRIGRNLAICSREERPSTASTRIPSWW